LKPTSFACFYGLLAIESCKFNQDFPNFALFILTKNFPLVCIGSLVAYYQAIVILVGLEGFFCVLQGAKPPQA